MLLQLSNENDQSMDTTAPPPKNEDKGLNQEVRETLKRRYSSTSAKCQTYETFNKTPLHLLFDSPTREQPRRLQTYLEEAETHASPQMSTNLPLDKYPEQTTLTSAQNDSFSSQTHHTTTR